MADQLPDFIVQGERARLFPVLSTTSKEGRTTSIVLACLTQISEFGSVLLRSVGQRVGVRTKIDAYTEVVLKNRPQASKDRPDGLIVLRTGGREWRALVEAKVGSSSLDAVQIEKYRGLAKDNGIDCVISISNQFATTPNLHPMEQVQKSRSKIPVYHWSWMHILTEADLLISQESVSDIDQRLLLNELRRFLTHESAGVKGFDRMPKEWSDLNKLVSSGGVIPAKSEIASTVVAAWHQELRDLALILSRMTETAVSERLSKKHRTDQMARANDDLSWLREETALAAQLEIPDAAAPLEMVADLRRRCIDVGMTLRAPEDKVSTKARVNWLLRQIKTDHLEGVYLRLLWPGKSDPTQHLITELQTDSGIASEGKAHLTPHSFYLFQSNVLGGRFSQQANFISDLENVVPAFYREIGSKITPWKKSAPKIKHDRASSDDVTPNALAQDAQGFEH